MESMKSIPSYVKKIQTLADKSVQLVFETQELSPDTVGYLFSLVDSYGYLLYFKNPPKPEDVDLPDFAPEFKTDKTPSQRLRGVLFILWKQGGEQGDFDFFYKQELEKIITHFKDKLVQ